ncbi:NADH-quinone oxidoreductase subunit J family protein [Calderihabitans maritimus]|uniref:NADH-quinone oxidoreductase subunit J family protein n=1 Tax=Calderihabitans maritimus TaxID=1246530 RepID=UPI001EDF542A|nr:NADH-quinone oxidoreductase subunit J [Calderihabitans maritimus]
MIFWLLTALIIGSALAVVLLKNIVHSALYLMVTFVGVAGIYILLEADFLAAVQILVYVGAVSILLVFGVMLTRRGDIRESNPFNRYKGIAALVALVLFLLVERFILGTSWTLSNAVPPADTVGPIAEAMLSDFVVPFEAAAILLLVAMVGAIILARGVTSRHD